MKAHIFFGESRVSDAAQYRPDIDGLRAVAVALVLLFHAFPTILPGGFVGVDVFLVVSGYLITGIILRDLKAGTFSIKNFYERRCRRILPALILVLVTVGVCGALTLWTKELVSLGKHMIAASTFSSNVLLWREAGYFDSSGASKPLLHLWSLGIEEQFYVVWPLCLYIAYKCRWNIVASVAALMVVSLCLSGFGTNGHRLAAFYLPPTRLWELSLGGCLAALEFSTGSRRYLQLASNIAAVVGLSAIIGAAIAFGSETVFPGWSALLPTFGTALLIGVGNQAWFNKHILSTKPFVAIGRVSYPLYLWHWPILSFNFIWYGGIPSAQVRVASLLVSLVLAWLTYAYVERQFRIAKTLQRKIAPKPPTKMAAVFAWSALGLCASMALGCVIFGFSGQYLANRPEEKVLRDFGWDLFFEQQQYAQPGFKADPLIAPAATVIVGDSHASVLLTGLIGPQRAELPLQWSHSVVTGCPPLLGVSPSPECHQATVKTLTGILQAPEVDTIILASKALYSPLGVQDIPSDLQLKILEPRFVHDSLLPVEQRFYDGYSRTIRLLLESNRRVIFMVDVPTLPFQPSGCLKRRIAIPWVANACELSLSVFKERTRVYQAIVVALVQQHPRLEVYDPTQSVL